MLIKNTDHSYCKIKETKVSGLKAYVTLVIYSSAPQTSQDIMGNINRVFSFYLRDLNSRELQRLSHNNYWIDRNNNYNNDSSNIDINMYKEIILEVDITNNNQSDMQDSRWIRRCNIVMLDHTTSSEEVWVSEDLELISNEIQLPKFNNLKIISNKDKSISVSFKLSYESQEDFNYINSNLVTAVNIQSVYTDMIIESLEYTNNTIQFDSLKNIEFNFDATYTEPVIINILIKNLKGDVLYHYHQFFNPTVGNTKLTVKDTELLNVKTITVKDTELLSVKAISNN